MIPIAELPHWNACLNTASAALLAAGYVFIRKDNRKAHARCMLAALACSILFLAGYLTYHYFHGSTRFPGQGGIRTVYFSILLSHTILAMVIVPMVGLALWRAARGQFERHKKIARWTLPLWFYVSVTGVLIYLFLYHWYPQP